MQPSLPTSLLTNLLPHIQGHPFDTSIIVVELNENGEPTTPWTARAVRLSRSHLVVRSKKLCYVERYVLIAIHLLDADPTCLAAVVKQCDYIGGMHYALGLALVELPQTAFVDAWIAGLQPRVPRKATHAALRQAKPKARV